MTNRTVWDSKVKEIIWSTNGGQIDILPNHICRYKYFENNPCLPMANNGLYSQLNKKN